MPAWVVGQASDIRGTRTAALNLVVALDAGQHARHFQHQRISRTGLVG